MTKNWTNQNPILENARAKQRFRKHGKFYSKHKKKALLTPTILVATLTINLTDFVAVRRRRETGARGRQTRVRSPNGRVRVRRKRGSTRQA